MPCPTRPPAGAECQRFGHTAIHLHQSDQVKHVSVFVCRHGLGILGQRVSHVFEGETEFVGVDELGDFVTNVRLEIDRAVE